MPGTTEAPALEKEVVATDMASGGEKGLWQKPGSTWAQSYM